MLLERVTVRLPRSVLDAIDDRVESGEYPNRSEVVRDALAEELDEDSHIDSGVCR